MDTSLLLLEEKQFYKKLRKLKNIDDNLKRVKIKKWLVDV